MVKDSAGEPIIGANVILKGDATVGSITDIDGNFDSVSYTHLDVYKRQILFLAEQAFRGKYDRPTLTRWLKVFIRRFFAQQFKRSAMPDGPKVAQRFMAYEL